MNRQHDTSTSQDQGPIVVPNQAEPGRVILRRRGRGYRRAEHPMPNQAEPGQVILGGSAADLAELIAASHHAERLDQWRMPGLLRLRLVDRVRYPERADDALDDFEFQLCVIDNDEMMASPGHGSAREASYNLATDWTKKLRRGGQLGFRRRQASGPGDRAVKTLTSPNSLWGTPLYEPFGGPSSLPPTAVVSEHEYRAQPVLQVLGLSDQAGIQRPGKEVKVVVLDTATATLMAEVDHETPWPLMSTGQLQRTYADGIRYAGLSALGSAIHAEALRRHGLFVGYAIRRVAPQEEVQIEYVRVLSDEATGTLWALIRGLARIRERNTPGTPLVVNLSLGLHQNIDELPALYEALRRLRDWGVIIVAAAGNDRSYELWPAKWGADPNLPPLIGVSALKAGGDGKWTTLAGWSSAGGDVAAPGEQVALFDGKNYLQWSGTSFATPLVTGVVARLLSLDVPPWQIRDLLLGADVPLAQLDPHDPPREGEVDVRLCRWPRSLQGEATGIPELMEEYRNAER